MRTLTKTLRFGALVLALGGLAVACGSDGEGGGGDDPPPLGDGDDGDDGSDNPDGNDNNPDGDDGSSNTDGDDGSPDGDDCPTPTTSIELLNSCAPEGVERRQFNNVQRLPENYDPNGPLPELP